MRISVKLLCLAVTVMATFAFSATSASALDTVEVVNESTGTHCTNATCSVKAVGVATYRIDLGIFGEAHEATCPILIAFTLGVVAGMAISAWINRPGDANCTDDSSSVMVPCKLPWGGSGEEDGPTGVVQMATAFCMNPAESSQDCEGTLAFSLVEQSGEHYETQFNNASVQLCELDVDFEFEGPPSSTAIHINHP